MSSTDRGWRRWSLRTLSTLGVAGTLLASGCASTPDPAPGPVPAPSVVSECDLQTNDVGIPPGASEMQAAARAAELPLGVFVATRGIFERSELDRGMIEAFVRVCSQEPLSRSEVIAAGTAVAAEIARQDAGATLERLTLRGWHVSSSGELVDAGSPVGTAFQEHTWVVGGAPDGSRWD